MAFKNGAVTDFWFNLAHIQPKCCKYIHSVGVPNYVTNFMYNLIFSNTATRNTMQTQTTILLFYWAARFTIPNILPSMALTMPNKVTSGNMWVQRISWLSHFHLYPVSCIVLELLDPCGGRRYNPMKHEQVHYSAPTRPKTSPSKQWSSPTLYHQIYNWPRHKENLAQA